MGDRQRRTLVVVTGGRRVAGLAALLLAALLAAGLALPAGADTVYLKNGRVIRNVETEVDGDRLVFVLHGSRVAIPLELVERVEEAPLGAGPEVAPGPGAVPPGVETPAAGTAPAAPGTPPEPAEVGEVPAEAAEEEIAPEQTKEYWQELLLNLEEERAELQAELEELRREGRAFLFSHRSTTEIRARIEAVEARLQELGEEERALRRRARQQGVPPGWLRLPRRPAPGSR